MENTHLVEPRIGQTWYVSIAGKIDFIGELTCLYDNAAAFVVHATLGLNANTAHEMLGQVIVVPRQTELWGFLSGPR